MIDLPETTSASLGPQVTNPQVMINAYLNYIQSDNSILNKIIGY